MDDKSSAANTFIGVPMPPTAWALASVWSTVWDAPRFRGPTPVHPPALSREALAPLLKLAASCVAALQPPHTQGADSGASLPPFGASRELLVAAVDGDPAGAPLANPSKDPTSFVRALVHAAFMTGDGDYVMGTSEDQLNELLEQHCSSQLAYAAMMLTDPTNRLKAALGAATAAIGDVLATPPTSGDLAAAAARLALIQRLERITEEAQGLLEANVDPYENDEANVESTSEMIVEDDTVAPLEVESMDTSDDAGGDADTVADEALLRTQTVITPDTQTPRYREASNDEEPPLKKTKSQIAKTLKVEKVAQSIEKRKEPVHDLRRTVSHLAKNNVPNEISALEAQLDAVESARKHARNFGEDLVEDMLALDGLGALSNEDRNTRKAAISGIEALLEDVDAAKARLATLHKNLENKLEESKKAVEAEDAKRAGQAEVHTGEAPVASGLPSARRAEASSLQAAKKLALDPPLPEKDTWRKLRLPLRFHSGEHRDHYLITATLPGLDPDDIKLELGDDATTLTVAGLRVPSHGDASFMRKRIAARFADIARKAPQRLQELGAQAVTNAYLELGQGEFGRFSESFRMPEDASVNDINASYRDGVLRVIVPKKARHPLLNGVDGDYGPGNYFRGAGGYPRRRAARQAPSAPGGGTPFFGGHDDSLWW